MVSNFNATFAEKLQLDLKLTLETTIARVCESKTVKKQQPVVQGKNPQKDGIYKKSNIQKCKVTTLASKKYHAHHT